MARRLSVAAALSVALAVQPFLGAHGIATARTDRLPAVALQSVTVGIGYVPNVQFAPFYTADALGYYRRAGLTVHLSYGFSPNVMQLVAAGREQFALADGTDAIAAVTHGIPVTSIATLYRRLPVAVYNLRKYQIRTVRDLRGKTVGIPGRFGSSYDGLLAALYLSNVKPSELSIRTIGYTQNESLITGKVEAAVGYSNNEPVLLQRLGYPVRTIEIGTQTHLVGAGLVAGNRLIATNPALVKRFVGATLRGLKETVDHPAHAFAISRRVPGLRTLSGRNVGDQYAVLLRSIAFWHDASTDTHGLGYAVPAQWRTSADLLRKTGRIASTPSVSRVFTNRFIPGAGE
ncbi:MAG TPA: ABC transporter substrate-binding protein [Chloroflexota bacterium]